MEAPTETIEVRVKYTYGTYIARARGKAASCTAGERQAVQALADKLGCSLWSIEEDWYRKGIYLMQRPAP